MGKPVVHLSIREGYRLWAASYDVQPNPLLALEERAARPVLGPLAGLRIVDVCAGTGRWMSIARSTGAKVIGIDLTAEMLYCAARKPGCATVALADLNRIPIRTAAADLAICSFGLSYVASVLPAFQEMARIARRVMVSDLHPAAVRAGWSRSFDTASRKYCVAHYAHSLDGIDSAARAAGLSAEHNIAASFAEPERKIFARAGKDHVFDQVSAIPAVYVKTWVKRC
jgi:ubiquinone/menaquinone biosynthesis C-methylase UbiE